MNTREAQPVSCTARQLTDSVWSIDEGMVRCFLVVGEHAALLIDSGIVGGDALGEVVRSLTNKPTTLVLTHADGDHTGGQDNCDKTLLHPSEYSYYASKLGEEASEKRTLEPVWGGDVFDLGGIRLEVILVPGHTPGSLALLDYEGRQLFAGDSVSDAWIHMFGNGRSLRAFIQSLIKLEDLAEFYDVVHCCHGSATLEAPWVEKTRVAAQKLLAGELSGEDPPRELPCKAYRHNGVTLLY